MTNSSDVEQEVRSRGLILVVSEGAEAELEEQEVHGVLQETRRALAHAEHRTRPQTKPTVDHLTIIDNVHV